MTDTIEITVDGKALIGGIIGGIILIIPNVIPLLYSGPQTAAIASKQPLFLFAGVVALLLTLFLSINTVDNQVFLPKRSVYTAVLAFLLITATGYAAVPVSAALTGTGNTDQITGDNLHVATLDVEGMVCQGCRLTVKNYLESLDGTKQVTASLPKKQATVIYDASKLSAQEIADSQVFQGAYSATIQADHEYRSGEQKGT